MTNPSRRSARLDPRTATGGTSGTWVTQTVALRGLTKYSYDANGNYTDSGDGAALTYDAGNRTTSIQRDGTAPTTYYDYRGAGQSDRRWMSPVLRPASACADIWGCSDTATRIADLATFESTRLGVSAETDDGATTYYVRDPSGGLVSERTPTGGTFYYLTDVDNSVSGLVDAAGNVVAGYTYDPFGRMTGITGGTIATNNPWRYRSAYLDGTSLYHLGERYYDPTAGRFTQQDSHYNPIDPKSWNRYVYTGDDPVNYSDPNGTDACSKHGALAGGLFAGLKASIMGAELFSKVREGIGLLEAATEVVAGTFTAPVTGIIFTLATVAILGVIVKDCI